MKQITCECGRPAKALVRAHKIRHSHIGRLAGHDLCQRCWEATVQASNAKAWHDSQFDWHAWLECVDAIFGNRPVIADLAYEIARHVYRTGESNVWANDLPSAGQPWAAQALLELSRAGLLSRCPDMPLFTCTLEPDSDGAEQQQATRNQLLAIAGV